MTAYDPEHAPDPAGWLGLNEDARLALVIEHHERAHIASPNVRLHAAIHVVVENQIAIGDRAVRETVARLQANGLSRHDALHRIGDVVTEILLEASSDPAPNRDAVSRTYEQRLAALIDVEE